MQTLGYRFPDSLLSTTNAQTIVTILQHFMRFVQGVQHWPFHFGGAVTSPKNGLSAASTPAGIHSGGDDRQNGPTSGSSYYLTDDGAEVEVPQGWDQGLQD
jgi:hypothetical protein